MSSFPYDDRANLVAGGRFREQYYWDSFWIVEGLLESQLYDIANATLQNFMDELDTIGFIPNGGRIYCERLVNHLMFSNHPLDLNRSQPPLFIQVGSCDCRAMLRSNPFRCSRDMWKFRETPVF